MKTVAKAENGNTVTVHYVGTLDDGTEFDSSVNREPLSFTVGAGEMISGFDKAIEGMKVGEKKNISLEPEQAYGEVNPEAFQTVPNSMFPQDFVAEKGVSVMGQTPDGEQFTARVHSVLEEGAITLDFNHPMAGKNLNFEIELVSVNKE